MTGGAARDYAFEWRAKGPIHRRRDGRIIFDMTRILLGPGARTLDLHQRWHNIDLR